MGAPTDLKVAIEPIIDLPLLTMVGSRGSDGNIQTAVGSTVLILSGSGHGSGFLISSDGYFLTNEHVVGQAKYVKIRWADGSESLGEVLRVNKGRDIALIKSGSVAGLPLPLNVGKIEVGQQVRAIGAPLDEEFQNTVTSGIVSATRIIDGYRYIQSDVSVVPGNSGGPLINSRGEVIGVTVAGMRINDAPQGVNFFIPISDAKNFLAIDVAEKE